MPKIPSMKIMDLAKAICPDCEMKIVGIRAGEKLHEVMVPIDDARRTLEYEDHYIIQPDFRYFERRFNGEKGKPVAESFEYNSGTNPWFLSIDEMNGMIEKL